MSFLENLHWRYAVKEFDTEKRVSEKDLNTILEAIRLAPASTGLQAYRVIIVENTEVKKALKPAAYNQNQIDTSSYVLAFSARKDLTEAKDEFFSFLSGGNAEVRTSLAGYEKMITGLIGGLEQSGRVLKWSSEQVHIALGFALAACAELQIDSCPMGGFDAKKVGEILEIPDTEEVVVLLTIGYRKEGDGPRSNEKQRLPSESLFRFVKE